MSKITQKQLIEQLKALKEIKPRQEWASLLKSQILTEEQPVVQKNPARFAGIFSASVFQRKYTYALAVLAIMVVGVAGLIKFEMPSPLAVKKVAVQSQANLTAKTQLTQNIASLKAKINTLKTNDPIALKEIAISLKTLSEVQGTDLTTSSGVQNLYQTVVENQISDLKEESLTTDQQKILSKAEDLFSAGKYSDSLEQILTISGTTSESTQP